MSIQNVNIVQDGQMTGGHLMIENKGGICVNNTVTNFDYTWPFIISGLEVRFNALSNHIGDVIDLTVGPDSTLSTISSPLSAGSNTLVLDGLVSQYGITVAKGFYVSISDGVNTDNLGRVLSVDTDTNTITIENVPSNSYTTATVTMTIYIVKDYHIETSGMYVFGSSKMTGSLVPSNTPVRFSYDNKENSSKEFYAQLGYLY